MARRARAVKPVVLPRPVIDYLMMERGREAAPQRFTADGGIVADIWYRLGENLGAPIDALVTPVEGVGAVEAGSIIYDGIAAYRRSDVPKPRCLPKTRERLKVAPLEVFATANLYADEIIRVILPLTSWWSRQGIGWLNPTDPAPEGTGSAAIPPPAELRSVLRSEIVSLLKSGRRTEVRHDMRSNRVVRRIRDAASVAALIGLVALAADTAGLPGTLPEATDDPSADRRELDNWFFGAGEAIADTAISELSRDLPPALLDARLSPASDQAARLKDPDQLRPIAIVHRVFCDRRTELAVTDGICTIKADAANRVFDISCRDITWAVIDSGIDATHPAFADHDARRKPASRIKAIFDFTLIDRIRDLALAKTSGAARKALIAEIVAALKDLPDYPYEPGFDARAAQNLDLIAEQLALKLQPDWALIEPLIRRRHENAGEPRRPVISSHGTHVAGILGADWREDNGGDAKAKALLKGICPDINLYDLRVVHRTVVKSSEYALIAALEYVRFANSRTLGMKQVIHGVNISMSIPHEVRNYACGATPVCVSCNNLVGAGVVVVAAAGNRGWNEQQLGFGNFVLSSITDPGNAEDVITVGSTHRQRPHTYGVSYFSSRGPTGDGRMKPDLVAPGESINGPIPDGSSDELDGTSMAAPFVSAAAAMLIARDRELSGNPRRIKQILLDTATDLGRERYFQGRGLLDVLRALQSV